MAKKKTTSAVPPASAAVTSKVASDGTPVIAFTTSEAKKLAKLLKASDRTKRLDAIRNVSVNHTYIASGGCLLPLLESLVPKKKTEEVVRAAGQVITDYLIGRDAGDPTRASDTTLATMQEAKKKVAKYKLAEVLSNMLLGPDETNSWNSLRCLRSMAAVVASLPEGSSDAASLRGVLLGPGRPVESLCGYLKILETRIALEGGAEAQGAIGVADWTVARLYAIETIGIMCALSVDVVRAVVSVGAVPILLEILRSVTASENPDLSLLTSILVVLFAVAKVGDGGGCPEPRSGADQSGQQPMTAGASAELEALAAGGAWSSVYDALKGPCMARAADLQLGASGKKGAAAMSADLAACLDNMARCAEVLRVMAMTGAGLEAEGALEAGIAAMSSILGMPGLPKQEAAVANLMTGMVKAMGSIACLSEANRVKVCSAGAAEKVLALMAPTDHGISAGAKTSLDTTHGRHMRKTAEKCLHHLLVSRITWLADDRALCDTSAQASNVDASETENSKDADSLSKGLDGASLDRRSSTSRRLSSGSAVTDHGHQASLGPAYLTVDAIVAAVNAECIDVRCRAIRLLHRLMSSRRCAMALGAVVVPALSRLVAWWLRTKDHPEAHRTPRPPESEQPTPKPTTGKKGSKGSTAAAASTDEKPVVDEATLAAQKLAATELEEADGTRVLRDEALAYGLTIMLELARSGPHERAVIGTRTLVALLVDVLKSSPCTREEFYANVFGSSLSVLTGNLGEGATACFDHLGEAVPQAQDKPNYDSSHADCDGLPLSGVGKLKGALGKPNTFLDLSSTCRLTDDISPRRLLCWRGETGRDPYVSLFNPLDWGWDFQVSPAREPVHPGLILRAAVLQILLVITDGYDPSIDVGAVGAIAEGGVASKGGSAAAAAAASEATEAAAEAPGAAGALAVLEQVVPVCVDLLSVDVCYGDGDAIHDAGAANSGSTEGCGVDPAAVGVGDSRTECRDIKKSISADMISGLCVKPSYELVHEEIRVACLRLVSSMLRLGTTAREELLSVAENHRNRWSTLLAPPPRTPLDTMTSAPPAKSSRSDKARAKGAPAEVPGAWVKPETFSSWDLRCETDTQSLRAAVPYIRTVSLFLRTIRNEDAPITNIKAALEGLGRLCMQVDYEPAGAQPEPMPADVDLSPLPASQEGTTEPLVDTLAGVAVGMGALVPLVSIWGCALAAAGSGELPQHTAGIVKQCQGLIDYLIRRGHAREKYWSSLLSLDQVSQAKAAATELAAPKKNQRKSKGGVKGSRGDTKAALSAQTADTEEQKMEPTRKCPVQPAGRPDPNEGPDRDTWARLLNATSDEQRTRTRGMTALLMATITGLDTAVNSLLLAGADPNVHGADGRSALMCALAQGMDDAARGLIEAGADVDAVDLQGSSVLKCAFACPARQAMRDVMRRQQGAFTMHDTPRCGKLELATDSVRPGSTPHAELSSTDRGASGGGRPRSRTRRGSLTTSRSRSRSRSGSVSKERRRSSLCRSVSFGDDSGPRRDSDDGRRLSRAMSMSAVDSARAALLQHHRRESAATLKTPRGTIVVLGDARMVPYILECGADPNVSSGAGDFPLHWAVVGTDLTVRVMNHRVKIVASASPGMCASLHECAAGTTSEDKKAVVRERQGDEREQEEAQLELLRVLVGAGCATDACNPEGMTALHAAVLVGQTALAEALLDGGASPNVMDSLGCLPLHYACLRATQGYEHLAKRLLALGVGRPLDKGIFRDERKGKSRRQKLLLDVELIMRRGLAEATAPSSITQHRATRSELLNFVSAEGFTPFHYVCDGSVASRDAAASVIALADRRRPSSTRLDGSESGNGIGWSPATCADRVDTLKWLLSEPELDPKIRVPHGATALHLAAQILGPVGSDLVSLLVRRGGINLDVLNTSGDAPVRIDIPRGYVVVSNAVSCTPPGENADPDSAVGAAQGGTTLRLSALHYALQAGAWESADFLLLAGAKAWQQNASPSCLHVACLAGAPASLVQKLLDEAEAADAVPHGCEDAMPPGNRKGGAVQMALHEVGSGAYAATPLHLAAMGGHTRLVELLLQAAAGVDKAHNAVESDGRHMTSARKGDDALEAVSTYIWSTNHSSPQGLTPVHAAASGGHTETVQMLVDAETRFSSGGCGRAHSWLNSRDAMQRTPLDVAVCGRKWVCAETLARADAFDIRLAIEGGPSSALILAERANMEIVDEGSGEASALAALRQNNKLLVTLLRRLSAAAAKDSAGAAAFRVAERDSAATATVVRAGDESGTEDYDVQDVEKPSDNALSYASEGVGVEPSEGDLSSAATQRRRLPTVDHLHPCFAEGVLYSNAKGIFIPDTPGRRKHGRPDDVEASVPARDKEQHHHDAATVIQTRFRQAGAKKAVSLQRQAEPSRRSSAPDGDRGVTTRAANERERAAVVIQAQARGAKARGRIGCRTRRASDCANGVVGEVVKEIPAERQKIVASSAGA